MNFLALNQFKRWTSGTRRSWRIAIDFVRRRHKTLRDAPGTSTSDRCRMLDCINPAASQGRRQYRPAHVSSRGRARESDDEGHHGAKRFTAPCRRSIIGPYPEALGVRQQSRAPRILRCIDAKSPNLVIAVCLTVLPRRTILACGSSGLSRPSVHLRRCQNGRQARCFATRSFYRWQTVAI
jgi:hypothetical protein